MGRVVLHNVAIAYFSFTEILVQPVPPANTIIPTRIDPTLDESTALTCGIVLITTAFILTWTTPNGTSFTPDDLADSEQLSRKYIITNGMNFPQESILTVMRLSYLDSGNYTCSVEFTGGPSAGMTGSAEFQITLLGKCTYMYILHDREGNTGEYSVQGWQYWPDRREGQYIT